MAKAPSYITKTEFAIYKKEIKRMLKDVINRFKKKDTKPVKRRKRIIEL